MGLKERVRDLETRYEYAERVHMLREDVGQLRKEIKAIKEFLGIKSSYGISMIKKEDSPK